MQFESSAPAQIVLGVLARFWPVWVALADRAWRASFVFTKRLGLYGQLFDSGVGIAGRRSSACFWLFTAIFAATDRALRSAGQIADHEGRAARRDRAGTPACVYLFGGDKLARDVFSRMVYRQPDRADHRAGGDAVRAHGRHHARPAGRLFRRPDRHGAVVPGQSGAGLPGHPAVLPAGDAGHHGHADPLCAWPALFFLFPIIFFCVAVLHAGFKQPARAALPAARADAGARRLGLCRPGLRRRSARHHPDRARTSSTSSSPSCSPPAPACSASCAA